MKSSYVSAARNLVTAVIKINRFSSSKEWKSLTDESQEKIIKIRDKIIHLVDKQKYSLRKDSILAQYWRSQDKRLIPKTKESVVSLEEEKLKRKPLTQQAIIDEQIETIEKNRKERCIVLEALLKELDDKSLQLEDSLQILLQYLKECLRLILDYNNQLIFPQFDKPLYQSTTDLGRFIPKTQATDMNLQQAEVSSGVCFGFTMLWVDHIGRFGLDPDGLYINGLVHHYQEHQKYYSRGFFLRADYTINSLSIKKNVQELIQKLEEKRIYCIEIIFKQLSSASHVVGIRKIPTTGEIELFDANLGIFVFENNHTFELWFCRLLLRYDAGLIRLYRHEHRSQPKHAAASLPPLSKSSPLSITKDKKEVRLPEVSPSISWRDSTAIDTLLLQMEKYYRINQIDLLPREKKLDTGFVTTDEKKEEQKTTLKEAVITKINLEIKRLTKVNTPLAMGKISTFQQLIERILQAEDNMSLQGVVDRWSIERNEKNQSNYSIISAHRIFSFWGSKTKSASFIDLLGSHFEINQYALNALQYQVFCLLCLIIQKIGDTNLPPAMAPILDLIKEFKFGHDSITRFFSTAILICQQKKESAICRFFNRDKTVEITQKLNQIISKIDLNDPFQLQHAIQSLTDINDNSFRDGKLINGGLMVLLGLG